MARQSKRPTPAQAPNGEAAIPLYLVPQGETWVGLDGPALRISRPDSAERLFPLRRIARVHSSPRVDWEQAALLACAEAGIPVLFVDDDGQVIARILGRPGQRDELRNRLVELLLRPEGAGMLRYWMDRNRQRAARWAAIKLGRHPGDARTADIRRWVNHTADRLAGADAARQTRQWLRSLAYGWMEAHLADLGFARSTELGQTGQPPLAADLTDILYWYLEPARLGWLQRRRLAAHQKQETLEPPVHRDAVRLFESPEARAALRGREITNCLHRWLIHET
jgi:hypothetical protein